MIDARSWAKKLFVGIAMVVVMIEAAVVAATVLF
jgi:hypothetical protein